MEPAAALLLSARSSVRDALARLADSDARWCAIRRVKGLVVFWYAYAAGELRSHLQSADADLTLERVLDMHEQTSVPVVAPSSEEHVPAAHAGLQVCVDGDRFVGVVPPSDATFGVTMAGAADDDLADLSAPSAGPRDGAGDPFGAPDAAPPPRITRGARGSPASGAVDGLLSARSTPSPATREFSAHPFLYAPDRVAPREDVLVTVGLARQAQPGVVGGPVRVHLPTAVQRFRLEVLLLVDGFEAPGGLRHALDVECADPDAARVTIPLVAPELAPGEDTRLATISLVFLHDGQPCGTASRRIAVVAPGRLPLDYAVGHGQPWTDAPAIAQPVNVLPGLAAPDLTVIIDKTDGDASSGRYVWSFASPHAVALPAAPLPCDLGKDSASLGGKIIAEVQAQQGTMMAELMIEGLGTSISAAIPAEFWRVLRDVRAAIAAAGQTRLPDVLLLSAESHVPWELALVADADRLLAGAPPLLGCQVNLGRWVLHHAELPPRSSVDVRHLAIVVGDYAARSGWRKLDKAEDEARTLAQRYPDAAITLAADAAQVKKLLRAQLGESAPGHGAEAVHFACHGEAMQDHALDAAIILENGQRLSPLVFAAAPLGKVSAPFMFMNACQVGRASELLASFSGFAGEALKGGFRGFLAPLWSVDDAIAHDIALEFYARAFGDTGGGPQPVAAILRELRARFSDDEANSLTRLAYVFYGHPGLLLRRADGV